MLDRKTQPDWLARRNPIGCMSDKFGANLVGFNYVRLGLNKNGQAGQQECNKTRQHVCPVKDYPAKVAVVDAWAFQFRRTRERASDDLTNARLCFSSRFAVTKDATAALVGFPL